MYRSIIEQIQAKGVLYNTMAQQVKVKKARSGKVSQRAIPRLAVRQPAELEQALFALYGVVRDLGSTAVITPAYVSRILDGLPPANPYHTNPVELTKTLRLLTLIDDSRLPTSVTVGIWAQSTKEKAVSEFPVTRRIRRRPVTEPAESRPSPTSSKRSARKLVPSTPAEVKSVDVFVGNLDYDASPEEVASLFSPFGEVISISMPPDFVTGRSRGFAFVRMADRIAAGQAIDKMAGELFRGRPLRVSW